MALLVALAALNLVLGFVGPVFIAYMLSFTTEATMGLIMSLGATGMLVGSILASSFKVTSGRVLRIVVAMGILGAMLVLVASSRSFLVILAALFVGMLVVPYAAAMSQSIWMAKVEPDVQGRVFAVRSMIAQITNPMALALVGPLADRVFVPLMGGDSAVKGWLESITGSGPGAGYAALFVTLGLGSVAVAVAAWAYGPLRHLERDVPDAEGLPTEASNTESEESDVGAMRVGIDRTAVEPGTGLDPA
jgi:MFS family permease